MNEIDHIIEHVTPESVLGDGHRGVKNKLVSLAEKISIDATGHPEDVRQMRGLLDRLEDFYNHQKQYPSADFRDKVSQTVRSNTNVN